ncbi:hypothetical protein ElyMa_006904100 [Elysia marginata]|uniref:Uncharacterized protein n=1 Tax=Elysia marginata TaxID=1093978 RepID=A0AAV4JGV2_9GAST|nr:hypothetical protein ElyMa_006904100 [Elysia marginata]
MAACEDSKQSSKSLTSDTGMMKNVMQSTNYFQVQMSSTFSTDALRGDMTERLDFSNLPWFFKALPNGTGHFYNTGWSQSESSQFDMMLSKIMNVHKPIDDRVNLVIGTYRSNWEATTEMSAMISEQDLCSRDDIVRRTSCTGRCGEPSDTRASPASRRRHYIIALPIDHLLSRGAFIGRGQEVSADFYNRPARAYIHNHAISGPFQRTAERGGKTILFLRGHRRLCVSESIVGG